jgi:DNA repair exonuclease SbcCD nuclease subunit
MFRFLHTADIHIDGPLHRLEIYEGAPVNDIRQASRRALENLIDLALSESVDFVLIAGDLFDGDWKDYHTGLYFVSQVRRLGEAGIHVFIVAGNHDAAGRMTRHLPYPDNVHVFSSHKPETITMDTQKAAIHGRSFPVSAVSDNLVVSYPEPVGGYFNIGLLHTSLTGRPGHENYAPCTLSDLAARGYEYWALGHVHRFEIAGHEPMVVFPGCIQGRHIRETGPKGCVLVTVREGLPPETVFHPLDVIRWESIDVDLTGTAGPEEALDILKDRLEALVVENDPVPLIVRATFTGKTAIHARMAGDPEYWRQAVRASALSAFGERVWMEKIRIETQPVQPPGPKSADPGPLRELEALTAAIKNDPQVLQDLAEELGPLFRKLPAEYRQDMEALQPDDADQMRRIIDQAHDLLVRRLMRAGGGT